MGTFSRDHWRFIGWPTCVDAARAVFSSWWAVVPLLTGLVLSYFSLSSEGEAATKPSKIWATAWPLIATYGGAFLFVWSIKAWLTKPTALARLLNPSSVLSVAMDDDYCHNRSVTGDDCHWCYRLKVTNHGTTRVEKVSVRATGNLFETTHGQGIPKTDLLEDMAMNNSRTVTEVPLEIGDPVYFRIGAFWIRQGQGGDGKIRGNLTSSPSCHVKPSDEIGFDIAVIAANTLPKRFRFTIKATGRAITDSLTEL